MIGEQYSADLHKLAILSPTSFLCSEAILLSFLALHFREILSQKEQCFISNCSQKVKSCTFILEVEVSTLIHSS